jgi:hypothetical protein
MLAGELKVAAYADLGGLGTKQGPPATFVWRLPNLLPVLVPWLAVLVLLALPFNRSAGAWWIWAPLAGLALLTAGVEAAFDASENEGFTMLVQGLNSVAFGLAAMWLLGAAAGRRRRVLGIPLLAVGFAAAGLLAFCVNPAFEEFWDLRRWVPALPIYLIALGVVTGIVYRGSLGLTAWICRNRFSGWRFSLRLPFWLWVMWLTAGGVLAGIITLGSGSSFELPGFLMGTLVFTLVGYALILPFLILSFTCPFYKERLKVMLKLPPPEAAPPPASPPVTEVETAR